MSDLELIGRLIGAAGVFACGAVLGASAYISQGRGLVALVTIAACLTLILL